MGSASEEISGSLCGLLPGECVASQRRRFPAFLALDPWGNGEGGTYQGLMGFVTRERQKSVCRSWRRHSHSI